MATLRKLLILLLLVSIASAVQVKPPRGTYAVNRNHPLARDLVGCWLLNEGAGSVVRDGSGNNNHGVIGDGGEVLWVSGPTGSCLSLPALVTGGAVMVPNTVALNITGHITLSIWVQYTTSGGQNARGILCKDDAGIGTGYGLYLKWQDNAYIVTNMRIGGSWETVESPVAHNDGYWHHVAAVYDGAGLWLYIDGQVVNSAAASGALATNSYQLRIGRWETTNAWAFFAGALDSPMIVSRALSPSEIASLYSDPYQIVAQPRNDTWLSSMGGDLPSIFIIGVGIDGLVNWPINGSIN